MQKMLAIAGVKGESQLGQFTQPQGHKDYS